MKLKRLIPAKLRLQVRIWRRQALDGWQGRGSRFAKPGFETGTFPYAITLTQPIHQGPLLENKLINIQIACHRIQKVIIGPGEIFSFWRILGRPGRKKGYKPGRNIIGGRLTEDYGGGLCQLAGIVYHLALIGGLDILERHNHSIDIYTDDSRYTPLGADATVVYGYKDLRLRNPYPFPLCFEFTVQNDLRALLLSPVLIPEYKVEFEKREMAGATLVISKRQGKVLETVSSYLPANTLPWQGALKKPSGRAEPRF